ncbi:MAG: PEP-CTERM sorting domain-containing protein [Planctomycetota bacterium]|jgi:hypothetical protein
MNVRFSKLFVACLAAAVLASAQPAPGADGNIYDFDSLTAGSIHGQDNWVDLDVANDDLEVQPPHPSDGLTWYGNSAPPCQDLYLTMYGGMQVFAATRNNDANWSFNLSGATKFVLGAPWVTDYVPVVSGNTGWGGEFRIVNSTTGKGIGFGTQGFPFAWKAYVDTAAGVSQSSRHSTGHTDQNLGPWTGNTKNQRIDFRLEVDLAANGGEGSATLYTVRRYAPATTWSAVPGLSDVNLQLVTQGADITNADQIYVWIGTRNVAQDSLMVSIPSGPLTVKAFLDKNLDGTFDSDDVEGHDELLTGFDVTIAGPCDCGVYGESPWDRTTDGSGEATVTEARAGAPTGFDGLDEGTYTITDRELYYYVAESPSQAVIDAGGGAVTKWYGVKPEVGDANLDGICDTQDFTILKAKLGTDPAYWADANFNFDTITDTQDFTMLKDALGSMHPDYVPPGGAVPEPATIALLALGGLSLLRRRRR